jgi:hypothetical protein
MYFDIMDQIKSDGLMPETVKISAKGNEVGVKQKHELFPALFNCQTNINRIINQMGGTIFAKSRIKVKPDINDEDDYLS